MALTKEAAGQEGIPGLQGGSVDWVCRGGVPELGTAGSSSTMLPMGCVISNESLGLSVPLCLIYRQG